jgi:hypothetical protein
MVSKFFSGAVVIWCVFVFTSGLAIAGPFGLYMGMPRSEFKGKLEEIRPHIYRTKDVPKKHSAFNYYILRFGPNTGLYYIKAVGSDISTNRYGKEVREAFDAMETKLKKIYGQNQRLDFLMSDSIWNEPRDWMSGLYKKERVLSANWEKETGAALKDDLKTVFLAAHAASRTVGFLVIEYIFMNQEASEAEIGAMEDDAL